jgi:hypothetical protein
MPPEQVTVTMQSQRELPSLTSPKGAMARVYRYCFHRALPLSRRQIILLWARIAQRGRPFLFGDCSLLRHGLPFT